MSLPDLSRLPTLDRVVSGLPLTRASEQRPSTPYRHTASGGFCSVCGSVWPCARAEARPAQPQR